MARSRFPYSTQVATTPALARCTFPPYPYGPIFKQCADYLIDEKNTTNQINWEQAPHLPQLNIISYEYLFDDDTFLGVTKTNSDDWTKFINTCVKMPYASMNA